MEQKNKRFARASFMLAFVALGTMFIVPNLSWSIMTLIGNVVYSDIVTITGIIGTFIGFGLIIYASDYKGYDKYVKQRNIIFALGCLIIIVACGMYNEGSSYALIGGLLCTIISFIFGIYSLAEKEDDKILAISGIVISCIMFLVIAFALIMHFTYGYEE